MARQTAVRTRAALIIGGQPFATVLSSRCLQQSEPDLRRGGVGRRETSPRCSLQCLQGVGPVLVSCVARIASNCRSLAIRVVLLAQGQRHLRGELWLRDLDCRETTRSCGGLHRLGPLIYCGLIVRQRVEASTAYTMVPVLNLIGEPPYGVGVTPLGCMNSFT
eukprot:4163723-Pyramimonas_sp.AAC.1